MVGPATDSEYLLARKTAEEYRSNGYDVQLEAVLDFFPDFRADLLVRKGDEVKVIEVKSRPSLAADPRISELAKLIDAKPGWSFELVLVGEPERVDSPAGALPFEGQGILRRLEQAEMSLGAGIPEAAFLLAWSAGEAALRELIAAEGVSDPRITSPRFVLDQAVFRGVISREEYDNLAGMLRYRNAIVHGFSADDLSDDLVAELIATIRSIAATPADEDALEDTSSL